MPGQKTCFRCASVLDGSGAAVDVNPPRAPRWKKPLRRMHHWLRRRTVLGQIERAAEETSLEARLAVGEKPPYAGGPLHDVGDSVVSEAGKFVMGTIPWVLVSTLPGAAHLIQGRFLGILPWLGAWFWTLFMGLFFFSPQAVPVIMLGVAVIFHAWVAADAALVMKRLKHMGPRLMALAAIALWIILVYSGVRATVLRGIVSGISIVNLPAQKVEFGDYLLCRELTPSSPPLARGDLVLMRFEGGRAVTQIVGLPGEGVTFEKDRLLVNGTPLDPERFPTGDWRPAMPQVRGRPQAPSGALKGEEYFVRMRYSLRAREYGGYGSGTVRGRYEGPMVVTRDAIEARAFMRWMPLKRRGSLGDDEDAE